VDICCSVDDHTKRGDKLIGLSGLDYPERTGLTVPPGTTVIRLWTQTGHGFPGHGFRTMSVTAPDSRDRHSPAAITQMNTGQDAAQRHANRIVTGAQIGCSMLTVEYSLDPLWFNRYS